MTRILFIIYCQRANVNNATTKNTLKQTNTKRNHSLFTNKLLGHVTKAAGIKVFFIPKDESSLIKLDSFVSAAVPCKQVSTSLTAETTAALPNNVHRLTQQACCCEPARAAAGRRQLNGTPAQWCVGMFSKRHGYGTDRQTDRWTNGHMDGV